MKKRNNKILVIICAIFSIFLGGFGVLNLSTKNVQASETPAVQTVLNYKKSWNLEYSDLSKIDRSYYSLTDEYMFFVENQTQTGLCWDFSICTMFENYLAVKTGELYDFSEAWVALARKVMDPSYVYGGGGNLLAFFRAISEYGLLFEDEFPFDFSFNIDDTNYRQVFEQYKDRAHKELFNDIAYVGFGGTDEQGLNQVDYVKRYLTNYGALNLNYNDKDRVVIDGVSYVCGTSMSANHAVTLVGWDDDISFVDKSGTSRQGAYIALNSWGKASKANYLYISYEDLCANSWTYGISESNSNDEIELENSSAEIDNYTINESHVGFNLETGVYKEQNVFFYGDKIDLEYKATGDYAGKISSVDIKRNGVNQKNVFSNFSVSNNEVNISTSDLIDSGVYRLYFNLDFDGDKKTDKTVIKQFTVLSGADMEVVKTVGFDDILYENFNTIASVKNENKLYGYTTDTTVTYYLNMGTYSKVVSVECSDENVSILNPSIDKATQNSYSKNSYRIVVKTRTQNKKFENKVTLTTLDGFKVVYNLVTYGITSEDKRAFVFYDLNIDDELAVSPNLYKYIAVGDKFDDDLSEPIKINPQKEFDGWFTDKKVTTQIDDLNSSLKVMNKSNYYDKNNSNPTKYTLFAYANWKNATLNFANETLNRAYGDMDNIMFEGASGGSGQFVYSIISSDLPSGVVLNLTNLQVIAQAPLTIGTYTISLNVQDTEANISCIAQKNIKIIPRDITYTIDNKRTNFSDEILALTGKVTQGSVVNNDDLQITLSCEVTKQSGIGSYEITGVANNPNYNVTFVNGTYYIVEKEILFTIDSYEAQYDGESHGITINLQNNISVEIEYKLQGGVYSTTPITFKDFTNGKQTVYVRLSSPNYNTVESYATISILKREIEVGWTNLSFTYNKIPQKPTAVVLSNTYGEVVDLTVSGEQTNAGNYIASVYTTNENFEIINLAQSFIINKANPVVDTSNITFSKDDLNKAQKLGDIPLPEGYSWNNPDQEIGEGENTYYITYTPQDIENYNSVDDIEVVIKRSTKEQRYFFIMILGLGIAILLAVVVTSIVKLQRYAYEKNVLDKPQKVKTHKPRGEQVLITFVTNAPFTIAPVETSKRIAIKLPSPERSSYKFAGWYTDKIFMHPYENNGVENVLTLYAKWEPKD